VIASLRWYTTFIEACADASGKRSPPLLLLELAVGQEQGIGFSTCLDTIAAKVLGRWRLLEDSARSLPRCRCTATLPYTATRSLVAQASN
jgi:hypothetical protein